MKLWVIAALLVFAVPTQAAKDEVLDRLANVSYFAFGPIGYAGTTSRWERDYKSILARGSAPADFQKLFDEGNQQAKCYALVGLHRLDPARFARLVRPLRDSNEEVNMMRGCIVVHEVLGDVIKEIGSGKYAP